MTEMNQAGCPKCGSTSLHSSNKGFSGGKGCCGVLLAGPFGLLCGLHGKNNVIVTCMNCKHQW
jgi:hypothetical protein